jgi:Zn-dependent protease with chaperone function
MIRVLRPVVRALTWTRSHLTAKRVTTVGVWSAALIIAVTVLAFRDVSRSVERQADATASRLAAAVERDIARNVELLDVEFGRRQLLFNLPQTRIPPFWTIFRATDTSASSRW